VRISGEARKSLQGKRLVDAEQIEHGKNAADIFLMRCLSEAICRGLYTVDEEHMTWAQEVARSMGGKQHEDLVLGTRLVSETTDKDLLWATSLSRERSRFLQWALRLVEGEARPMQVPQMFPGREAAAPKA
jgi:3-methyladenine DNA glycosylase AlkC